MFYKLIQNGRVIDVTDCIEYCKYQERNNLIIRCNADDEDIRGVISQRFGNIFHLADKPDFPQSAGIYLTVFLTEISESEYTYLLDKLNKEETPIDPEMSDIEMARLVKIEEMSSTCHGAIVAGVDVTLSDSNIYHFDLDEEDQTNLGELRQQAEKGIDKLPYHATGDLCIYYSAIDIITITDAAIAHKTYHTTYYNSLKNYINHIDVIDDVNAITYGVAIPEEYQSEVLKDLINQMSES